MIKQLSTPNAVDMNMHFSSHYFQKSGSSNRFYRMRWLVLNLFFNSLHPQCYKDEIVIHSPRPK